MAFEVSNGIYDEWSNLRQNPVFKRTLVPNGVRQILKSPVTRAIGLTVLAISAYEGTIHYFLAIPIWTSFVLALVFWFFIMAFQRYFCWMELNSLSINGNMDDYLNSGLSRADIAMGIIMPAEISESVAVAGVMGWFFITTENLTVRIVLALFIFLRIKSMFSPPFIFHPDSETYLRKRNPIALFFISIAVIVPLIVWFGIYFSLFYGILMISIMMGITITFEVVYLISIFGAFFIASIPINKFNDWRLRRFFNRYDNFDDLFERYIEKTS